MAPLQRQLSPALACRAMVSPGLLAPRNALATGWEGVPSPNQKVNLFWSRVALIRVLSSIFGLQVSRLFVVMQ